MSLVLDSSITLAWVYSAETTEEVAGVFARVLESGAWVPALWRLEVANVLEMGVRKSRSDSTFRDAALADLAQAKAAAERIRARAECLASDRFDWDALKADRDEGRP